MKSVVVPAQLLEFSLQFSTQVKTQNFHALKAWTESKEEKIPPGNPGRIFRVSLDFGVIKLLGSHVACTCKLCHKSPKFEN